jgi:hypothetical protein
MHNSIHSSNQSFVSLGKVIFSTPDPHCMIIELPLTSSPYYAFATSSSLSLLLMQLVLFWVAKMMNMNKMISLHYSDTW